MPMKFLGMPVTLEKSPPVTADAFLRGAVFNLLLVTASGILASFLFPPREVWWYGWLYLAPLMIALRRTSELRASGWLMLLFGLVFYSATLTWILNIFREGSIGIFLIMSLPMVLFGLGYRILTGRGRWWLTVLLAPVLWVALEWIRCEGWYFQFSWAQLGFGFASCRRSGVLFPYIGVYGVTFLLVLVNALVAEVFAARWTWWRRVAALAVLAIPIVPFSYYLSAPVGLPVQPEEQGPSVFRVLLVQDETGSLDNLIEHTVAAQSARPNLIAWPEYAIAHYPLTEPEIMDKLVDLARTMNATLVLGCKEKVPQDTEVDWLRGRAMRMMEGELYANSAIIISPEGEVLGTYWKTHPIQFFSDGVPGNHYRTFPTPVGRIGIAICYDFDFASTTLRLVRNGAELLVVPTYDSLEWSSIQHVQHARMAQARAAEASRWVIRPTTSGLSQVINPHGYITAIVPDRHFDSAMAIAAPRQVLTPYNRFGYLLPYACLAITGIWALWGIAGAIVRRRKKHKGAEDVTHEQCAEIMCD